MGQLVETGGGERADRFVAQFALQQQVLARARERRGAAGAALIDEHNVALAAQGLEGRAIGGIELDGALAGAARERHQRIGRGPERQRRHHGDAQTDAAGRGLVRIQRPLETAAARLDAGECRTGADPAVLKLQRGHRPGGDRQEDEHRDDGAEYARAHN